MLLAWPAAHTDWRDELDTVRECYRRLIAEIGAHQQVMLVVPSADQEALELPETRFGVRTVPLPYDDTWVRDSGPLTAHGDDGSLVWLDFRFDGWGGKFEARNDDALVSALAARLRSTEHGPLPTIERFDWVLEGGAIETDGRGTLMTTSRCLRAREPALSLEAIEQRLLTSLGLSRVLWVDHGELDGDDTDGHIDTIARFADEETIVHQACDDPEDPHFPALAALAAQLGGFETADGHPYRLVPLPLPDPVCSASGARLPAGYANFLIINDAVLVPTYDDAADQLAIDRLTSAFPDRRIIGVNCRVLIEQGGSLHCATLQLPAGTLAS